MPFQVLPADLEDFLDSVWACSSPCPGTLCSLTHGCVSSPRYRSSSTASGNRRPRRAATPGAAQGPPPGRAAAAPGLMRTGMACQAPQHELHPPHKVASLLLIPLCLTSRTSAHQTRGAVVPHHHSVNPRRALAVGGECYPPKQA